MRYSLKKHFCLIDATEFLPEILSTFQFAIYQAYLNHRTF